MTARALYDRSYKPGIIPAALRGLSQRPKSTSQINILSSPSQSLLILVHRFDNKQERVQNCQVEKEKLAGISARCTKKKIINVIMGFVFVFLLLAGKSGTRPHCSDVLVK